MRDGKAERLVRCFENQTRRRIRVGQRPAHAHELRSLSGKQKCNFAHWMRLYDGPMSSASPTSLPNAQPIMDLEREYLLQNYARYPLVLDRGKGCYVYDVDGNRYLDFIAGIGVNALGHAHPRIVKVIREQAGLLIHCSNLYYHHYQGPLAKKLAEISGLQRSFFCNSGTEAMEGALKMARAHGHKINPEKFEIVALDNSFHGRTLGALSVTGQAEVPRAISSRCCRACDFVPRNDMAALEQAVSERTAGIVIEWIQGEGGIFRSPTSTRARPASWPTAITRCWCSTKSSAASAGRAPTLLISWRDPLVHAGRDGGGQAAGLRTAAGRDRRERKSGGGRSAPACTDPPSAAAPLACRVALEFFDILDELLPSHPARR